MQRNCRSLRAAPDLGLLGIRSHTGDSANLIPLGNNRKDARKSGTDASAIVKEEDLLDIGEARLTTRKDRLEGRRQSQRSKGVALRQPGVAGRLNRQHKSTGSGRATGAAKESAVGSRKATALPRGEQRSDKATQLRRNVGSPNSVQHVGHTDGPN